MAGWISKVFGTPKAEKEKPGYIRSLYAGYRRNAQRKGMLEVDTFSVWDKKRRQAAKKSALSVGQE